MKALLHVTLFLAGLFGTAEAIRWCGSGFASYGHGGYYTPDGLAVPAAEIFNFLNSGGFLGGERGEHPRGHLMGGLRVKQGYDRPRWEYFDAQGCVLVAHNSLGFRDDEFPVEKPAGEFRVLALGDSMTYGVGVPGDDTWPQVLERRLREGGRPVQVINCGLATGDYSPAGYAAWMASDGFLLQPDLVLVGFSVNDLGGPNEIPMLSYQGVTSSGCPVALVDQFLTGWLNARAKDAVPDFAAIVRNRPEAWNATQQGLRELQRQCAERGLPLAVLVIPMISQLDREPNPYAELHAMTGEFLRGAGIPFVDALPRFLGKDELELWVHPTDQHPNHIGQRMLGDAIFGLLRERGFTPK